MHYPSGTADLLSPFAAHAPPPTFWPHARLPPTQKLPNPVRVATSWPAFEIAYRRKRAAREIFFKIGKYVPVPGKVRYAPTKHYIEGGHKKKLRRVRDRSMNSSHTTGEAWKNVVHRGWGLNFLGILPTPLRSSVLHEQVTQQQPTLRTNTIS